MTEAELLQAASAEAKASVITADAFLLKVRKDPTYPYTKTHWYHYLQYGQQLHDLPAPPPPPPNQLAVLGQNVLFTAWNPHAGLRAPVKYKLAITADVHVACSPNDTDAVRAQKAAAYTAAATQAAAIRKQAGGLVAVWGNQAQIGADQIQSFGKLLNADYLIFQAETMGEFNSAITGGAKIIIGNANSWTAAQRETAKTMVTAGTLVYIHETYTNQGEPWPEASSSQGVPAASLAPGVGWGPTPYQLPEYKLHTPPAVWPTISPYLAEDFATASWDVLP